MRAPIATCVLMRYAVLTLQSALELAKHNITVNAYAPGYINTDLRTVLRDMTPDMRTDAITGSVDRIAVPDSDSVKPGPTTGFFEVRHSFSVYALCEFVLNP